MGGPVERQHGAAREASLVRALVPETGRLIESITQRDPRAELRRTVIEICAAFLVVAGIEALMFEGSIGAFGVHPHPYWLILLPVAAARGLLPGILAAGIATCLYGVGVLTSPGAAGVTSVLDILTMRDPILFFAVVYIVGELRDGLATKLRQLGHGWLDIEASVERLEHERDVLAAANRELERRIVEHPSQVTGLLQTAVRLGEIDPDYVFQVALELVQEHCGGRASVVAVAHDGDLSIVAPSDITGDDELRRLDGVRESDLCTRSLRLAICVDGLREGRPGNGPLCVAPLLDSEGLLIALLCLDDVPTAYLNETTSRVFFSVAEWISASLCRIERGAPPLGRAAVAKLAPPIERVLGTPAELGERLRVEAERKARHDVPFSVIGFRSRAADAERAQASMIELFGEGLRTTDGLYEFGYPGCFVACLAATSLEAGEAPLQRVRELAEQAREAEQLGELELFLATPEEQAKDAADFVEELAARLNPAPMHDRRAPCPTNLKHTLGDAPACERRLDLETRLAQRLATELSVVEIQIDEQTDRVAPSAIEPELPALVRRADGAYLLGDGQLLVILPETPEAEAHLIAGRFERFLVEGLGIARTAVRTHVRPIEYGLGIRPEGADDPQQGGAERLAVA